MILKAIMDKVETGSITNVITRGNMEGYPAGVGEDDNQTPYVIIYDDYPINAYYTKDNTVRAIVVDAHFPIGNGDLLEEYIEHEIIELLHRQRLTDDEGYTFQIYATANVSPLSEPNDDRSISGGNDDKTISKTRRFVVPRRGA